MSLSPPADFHKKQTLWTRTVRRNSRWFRITKRDYPDALGAGYGDTRFSDPLAKDFTTSYIGNSPLVCFNETIWREENVGEIDPIPFDADLRLAEYDLAWITCVETLHLIDLTGAGPAKMGIPTEPGKGRDQTEGRAWSRAFWGHPQTVDGIYYRSRLNDTHFNLAIYDRAIRKLTVTARKPLLQCKAELADIYEALDILLV